MFKHALMALSVLFLFACRGSAVEDAARVEGVPIKKATFERSLKFELSKYAPKVAEDAQKVQEIKKNVLDELIRDTLLCVKAKGAKIAVNDDELAQEYKRYKSHYTEAAFQKMLELKGIKYDEWKEERKCALLADKLIEKEILPKIEVSDADIKKYYRQHIKDFTRGDEVHARQIVLSDLKKAEEVLLKIQNGDNFAVLAQEFSIAPEAKNGGDLGWFSRGIMPRAFDEACFPLPSGRISPIVKTEFGYHIFKVVERRPSSTVVLSQVSDKIAARIKQIKIETAFSDWFSAMKLKASIEINKEMLK